MRKLILALCLIPCMASAEPMSPVFREYLGLPPVAPTPIVVPVIPYQPLPADKGPFGQGYSVVTTTRPQRNLWDRDVTGSETVQRVVPNDAFGQPIRPYNPYNY